jgi:hypothetical protein
MSRLKDMVRPLFSSDPGRGRLRAQLEAVHKGLELKQLAMNDAFERYLARKRERMHILQQLALCDKDPAAREEYRFRALEQQEELVGIYGAIERADLLLDPSTEAGSKLALAMEAHRATTGMPPRDSGGGETNGGA